MGHPCLTPRPITPGSESSPVVRTTASCLMCRSCNNLLSLQSICKLFIISNILTQFTLSNAFQNQRSRYTRYSHIPNFSHTVSSLLQPIHSDIPQPLTDVSLTAYADDMNPSASHSNFHKAEQLLQPYLQDIFNWTKNNDLILNPDKSTATLFTPDKHEHGITLNLNINGVTIPTVKNPKILGLTLDPGFNFAEHARITKDKADSSIKILKALTSTSWGKQKETLLATYKTIVLPVIEYASTVWSHTISDSNLQKLQITQNDALRVITGCTSDTNIEHLHKETKTLPLPNHLKLHASQLRQKAQLPIHPLNDLTQQTNCPRKMKETIFQNWNRKTINIDNNLNPPTPESISNNIKTIHTLAVNECLT